MSSSSETRNLVNGHEEEEEGEGEGAPMRARKRNRVGSWVTEPLEWVRMLSSRLSASFVAGVILVYGLNHGFSGSFFRVVSDYYWKDVQRSSPSAVQLYAGLYALPWVMKPLWGLLTDLCPLAGFRRRPYFAAAGALGAVSALAVALGGDLPVAAAVACLVSLSAAMAVADVTIDACIARSSIEARSLAADLQSLCGFCSSAGALLGYATTGFFLHRLGPQGSLGLLAVPPALLVVLGWFMHEQRTTTSESEKTMEKLGVAIRGMYKTIKFPHVWKPSLYMYLSIALSISTHEGTFYWYTDPKAGPAFSQEFVGMIYAIGAMGSMVGVVIYHKTLKEYPLRRVLFLAQVLYAVSGMIDLAFVLRWNLALGIPDFLFVIGEECVHRIVARIRWIPMIVLSTRLCPLGIEGTFFALLMCIDSLAGLSSKWAGGLFLHAFRITRTDFSNLWLLLLLRAALRFLTLSFIFLLPDVDNFQLLVPSDLLANDSEDVSTQLVPLKNLAEI